MILCVAGSPSIDRLFVVEEVEHGGIHRPRELVTVPGGKGLNVARAAHALGTSVHATGMVAGHAGRWVEAALADEGVSASLVWTDGETRTSLSVAELSCPGRLTEFYEDAPPATVNDWDALRTITLGLFSRARWVTLSGSLPPGAPVDGYARLAGEAATAGISVALDARGAALARGLAVRPAIVKVNVAEAAEVVPVDPAATVGARALAAARGLQDRSGGAVIVTCGEEGLIGLRADGVAWRATLDMHGSYPVGSGDACLAGLVSALADGADFEAALALAVGTAAANALEPGAGRVDGRRARELAAEVSVVALDPARSVW